MTWLTPMAGLILAAGVVPPLLALYFLRLKRARRAIPSTMHWEQSIEDLRANAPFQRLRLSVLLILQLLATLLMVLAVMQPQADLGEQQGGRTVLLIDRSASMNANDIEGGATRLDEAKRQAIARVASLFAGGIFSPAPGQVMVVSFASGAEVVAPWTSAPAEAIAAISAIAPTDESTRMRDAIELARAFAQSGDATSARRDDRAMSQDVPTIEVYSDGRLGDSAEIVLQPGEALVYRAIGSADAANAGVVSIGAERSPDRPDQIQVYARLANWSPQPVSVDAQVLVDGLVRGVTPEPVRLDAAAPDASGEVWVPGEGQIAFPLMPLRSGGTVEVAIVQSDALAVDNAARLVTPPPKSLRILLVTNGGALLKSLLEGLPLGELDVVDAAGFAALASTTAELESYDAVVIDSVEVGALPRGRFLVFGQPPPMEGLNPYGEPTRASLRFGADDHTLLRMARLDDLIIAKLYPTAPTSQFEIVAESDHGPLVITASKGTTQAVLVPFDPLDSNWPFQRSFVNFVANALDWLSSSGEMAATEALRPGGVAAARLPPDAQGIVMRSPEAVQFPIAAQDPARITWGPIRRAGVWRMRWQDSDSGADERTFAVNVDARAEGRVAAAEELSLRQERVRGLGEPGAVRSSLWPWLLTAALLILLLEWLIYFRRV